MSRRSVPLAVVVAALLLAPRASAFKEHGHETVESVAYWLMLNELIGESRDVAARGGRACALPNAAVPGEQVLQELIEAGLLEPLANGALKARSHHPDQLQERQFSANGQCYHFMARPNHTVVGGHDTPLPPPRGGPPVRGVPRGLIDDAYVDCMGLIDSLVRGALYAPDTLQDGVRLAYTLLHAVEDSFSEAHASRDEGGTWDILYLKPWDIVAWPFYFTHPEGWRYYFGETHHTLSDDRDWEYLEPKTRDECRALPPETIALQRPACLSPRGWRAVYAVKRLLRLLHAFRSCKGKAVCDGLDDAWQCYQSDHLAHRHLHAQGQWRASWQEIMPWQNSVGPAQEAPGLPLRQALGVAVDTRYQGTYLSWEQYGFTLPLSSDHTSVPQFLNLSLQLRVPVIEYARDQPLPLGGAFELGAGIPVDADWGQARLGLNVLYTEAWLTRDTHHAAVGFGGAAFNLFLDRRFWLGVVGPRALFGTRHDDRSAFATFFTVKAGYGWR